MSWLEGEGGYKRGEGEAWKAGSRLEFTPLTFKKRIALAS